MEEIKPAYYSIIPASVRYDKDLNSSAKLLYGEITALCGKEGYCWSSNSYFAELYDVSKVTISRWISVLVNKGHLKSEVIYKENSREIQQRQLRIVDKPIIKNDNTPINKNVNTSPQKDQHPIIKNDKDNNTSINNTNNRKEVPLQEPSALPLFENDIDPKNQKNTGDKVGGRKPVSHPDKVDAEKFVEVFNSIAGRKFKVNDKIKSSLVARLKVYTKKEILQAVENAHKDKYHIETNFLHLTPEFILRTDKLEKFLNAIPAPVEAKNKQEGEQFVIGQRHNAVG